MSTPPPEFTGRTGIEFGGLALELWFPIALFAAAGIYLLQLSLRALPDTLRLNDYGFFPTSLVIVLVVALLLIAAYGVGLGAIGWLIFRADRVGRGLAYVAVGCLVIDVLFGDGTQSSGWVLSMLAGLAAAATLGFAPAAQEHFTGPNARQRDQPTSIVVARVTLMVWLILLATAAVLDFLLSDIAGRYALYGVLLALIAVFVFIVFRRLEVADREARKVVTLAAAIALVVELLGLHAGGLLIVVGLTIAVPACLWLPADARAFYGDAPLSSQ